MRDAWETDRGEACEKAGIDIAMTTAGEADRAAHMFTSLSVHRVRNNLSG